MEAECSIVPANKEDEGGERECDEDTVEDELDEAGNKVDGGAFRYRLGHGYLLLERCHSLREEAPYAVSKLQTDIMGSVYVRAVIELF